MLRLGLTGAALGVALLAATAASAAPAAGAGPTAVAAPAASSPIEQVYWWRGHYYRYHWRGGFYPYHWHGRYYRYRRFRNGVWIYF